MRVLVRCLVAGLVAVGCDGVIQEPPRGAPDAPSPPSVGAPRDLPDPSCTDPGRGNAPELVRRLTQAEYAATVEAALGMPGDPSLLAPEARMQGFANDQSTLLPTQQVVLGLADYARALTDALLAAGDPWLGRAPCADGTCMARWMQDVATPLFRRPPSAAEAETFGELFEALVAEGLEADAAGATTLRALLLAPQTVYRLEGDEGDALRRALDVASRRAFFVTGRGPDASLLAAAAELMAPEAREAQARRLLRTPEAGRVVDELAYGWLHLDTLEGLTPTGDAGFDQELVASAQALVRAVWLEDGGALRDVFRADYVVPVSARAARRLRVEGAPPGERRSVAGDRSRAGILTEPALLAGTGADSFPLIHRALFLYRDVLCESVPEPPPGVTEAQPGSPTDSERVQSESRAADGACGACHAVFDPLAYGLEPFGFSGEWRDIDVHGNATRTDGVFLDAAGVTHAYADPRGLGDAIAGDARVDSCVLRRIVRLAWGRALEVSDACDLAQIRARFLELGSTYEAAVVAIVTHPSFIATD